LPAFTGGEKNAWAVWMLSQGVGSRVGPPGASFLPHLLPGQSVGQQFNSDLFVMTANVQQVGDFMGTHDRAWYAL